MDADQIIFFGQFLCGWINYCLLSINCICEPSPSEISDLSVTRCFGISLRRPSGRYISRQPLAREFGGAIASAPAWDLTVETNNVLWFRRRVIVPGRPVWGWQRGGARREASETDVKRES